ncbi:hypothetical protein E2C01_054823 [Portunus trituberculatus]|uniref:Uncharacterized protein n=1 Tax=Portunus trituberculatus TaxID=210409 RepID=A0A5B7GUZ7_PORTR|nr:hypothetical protein [Portunus trituberculatus]
MPRYHGCRPGGLWRRPKYSGSKNQYCRNNLGEYSGNLCAAGARTALWLLAGLCFPNDPQEDVSQQQE